LQLQFWLDGDRVLSKYIAPAFYCGFEGMLHGGLIGTLLDEIAAWTVGIKTLHMGVTLRATITYRRPVPVGQTLILEGRIEKIDSMENPTEATVKSTILSDKGMILAEATSDWKFPPIPLFAKMSGIPEEKLEKMIAKIIEPLRNLN
jgi:hypothetical protein